MFSGSRHIGAIKFPRRAGLVAVIAAAFYVLVMCNPLQFALADLMQPVSAHNAASPYTMFERCHPEQFDIPAGVPC